MGSVSLDFAEFYRGARDECFRAVLATVGDQDVAQEPVDEALPARARRGARSASTRRLQHASSVSADGANGSAIDPRIMAALLRLPARQRQVVALRVFLDLDTCRTAEMLGVTPSTVKAHLARAIGATR